jgi:site-specific recombinase XerD
MNSDLYERYVTDLKLKGYAKRSRQSYRRSLRQFQHFTNKAFEDISEEDLREYWLCCKEELGWSSATLRISYSAIKHFFSNIVKREWEVLRTVRFERQQSLPVVLNIDEVRRILGAMRHMPQNHAFFTLVYSCGLRLSEALNIRVADIDGRRQSVHVHYGKGAKDRVIPLPETTIEVLRDYWKSHRNEVWLFPALGRDGKQGRTAERPVTAVTVQGALRRTLVRLGIKKRVTPHTFPHSYATHMLEAGVPVRHVQECLGHASLASVMIYLHITSHGKEDSRRRMNQLMRGVLS